MSDFKLTYEKREGYIYVKGSGVREDIHAIQESTRQFSAVMEETKALFVLLDYSTVVTIASNSDIFNITRMYETTAPMLHSLCISIIINPAETEMEKFWEDICKKMGFDFKIFTDPEEAKMWITKKSPM